MTATTQSGFDKSTYRNTGEEITFVFRWGTHGFPFRYRSGERGVRLALLETDRSPPPCARDILGDLVADTHPLSDELAIVLAKAWDIELGLIDPGVHGS